MYFNSARTNGYNFWQSAPWSFVGSLTWELFGEVWAPAPNDLANTTLGGITLGEMLYRVSSLTLKNEATGFERVVREVTAGLLNPVRGFNRVVRGEAWKVSQHPTRVAAVHHLRWGGGRVPPDSPCLVKAPTRRSMARS